MPFNTYPGGTMGKVAEEQPKATLLKQGNLNLNTAATNLFKERGVSHVQLLYDRDTNRMAFKPCKSTEEGAYPLRPKDTCCQVSSQSFVRFYGIRFGKKSTTYPAEWDDESGMLIVDLESSGLSCRFSDSLRVTEL